MVHRSTLPAAASAQLVAQLTGHVVALRRRRHVDVPFMTGSPDHPLRDWLVRDGVPRTALPARAPGLGRRPAGARTGRLRAPVLRRLGTGLTLGCASERTIRARLRPAGFDPLETPIVAGVWGGAVAMAVLARR